MEYESNATAERKKDKAIPVNFKIYPVHKDIIAAHRSKFKTDSDFMRWCIEKGNDLLTHGKVSIQTKTKK